MRRRSALLIAACCVVAVAVGAGILGLITAAHAKALLRVGGSAGNRAVNEMELHFDPALGVKLKEITARLGTRMTISHSETSTVRWKVGTNPGATVFGTLLSTVVAPEAIVIEVRIRPNRPAQ
jgi:hypothetical protein